MTVQVCPSCGPTPHYLLADLEQTVPVDLGSDRPYARLVLRVPNLVEDKDAVSILDRKLIWEFSQQNRTRPVDFLLDEFLVLADLDRESLRSFAAHWGPLNPRSANQRSSIDPIRVEEPESLWEDFAHLLQAVLVVAADMSEERTPDPRSWSQVLLGTSKLDLRAGDREKRVTDMVVEWSLAGFLQQSKQPRVLFREFVNRLLEDSGVRLDSGLGESEVSGPFYALPTWEESSFDWNAETPAVVSGLKPLLAMQTLNAIRRSKTIRRCDGCGRIIPLPPGTSKPRRGIPFYGNHEDCRREARLASKRQTRHRSYWREKAEREGNSESKPKQGQHTVPA